MSVPLFLRRFRYSRLCFSCRQFYKRQTCCSTNQCGRLGSGTHNLSTGKSDHPSSLFVSGAYIDDALILSVDPELDEILNHSKLSHNVQARRCENIDKDYIDQLTEAHQKLTSLRATMKKIETHQSKTKKLFQELLKQIKGGLLHKETGEVEKNKLADKGRQLKTEFHKHLGEFLAVEQYVMCHALKMPNSLHTDTPTGDSVLVLDSHLSSENVKISKERLQERLKQCVKFSNVGQKSYYLMSDAAHREHELVNRLSEKLRMDGFIQMACPEIFRSIPVEGSGISPLNPREIYNIRMEDAFREKPHVLPYKEYIRGTSVLPFLAYFTKLLVASDELPGKYFTLGRSYDVRQERSELPGLYGAPQNLCVEVAAMTRNESENEAMYHDLQTSLWRSLTDLDIPSRMVIMPARFLHRSERKRIEVQFWSPGLQQYVQAASLSCYGDYFSRRLMFRQSSDLKTHNLLQSSPIYTVHGRWANITHLVALHLEYS